MSNTNLGVWEAFKNTIRNHLNSGNISHFFSWPVLQQTMIAGVDEIEYQTLRKSTRWPTWEQILAESVLKPNSYHNFPSSSTNNMHHAYSLDVMMFWLGLTLDKFDTVVEFGGGYGNTARLFKKWGHKSDYYIYDIVELIEIQKYYLSSNDVNDVKFIADNDRVGQVRGHSLFLGLWSISEVPVSARAELLEQLRFFDCTDIFLAMGGSFYQENNIEWLNNEIIPKLNEMGYEHKLIRIEHGQDMFYFCAGRDN